MITNSVHIYYSMASSEPSSEEEVNDDNDEDYDEEWEDDESDEEDDDSHNRSLLWLCEEGQLRRALERFQTFLSSSMEDDDDPILLRELFQSNRDGNSALHEILMGGTQDSSAKELSKLMVDKYHSLVFHPGEDDYVSKTIQLFRATPSSHRRTILHWAAWGKAAPELILKIVQIYPEALCQRDKPDKGNRTPFELADRYWPYDSIAISLAKSQATYLPIRIRTCVHLCTIRWFVSRQLTPFDKAGRKESGLPPRSWFVASALGFALQREMKGLATHILEFVGHGAKFQRKKSKKQKTTKKRKRKATA